MIRPSICILILTGFSIGGLIGMNFDLVKSNFAVSEVQDSVAETNAEPIPDFRQHPARPMLMATIHPVLFAVFLLFGALLSLVLFTRDEEIEKLRKEIQAKIISRESIESNGNPVGWNRKILAKFKNFLASS